MYDQLRAWLPGCHADVLCLQEVTRTPDLRGPTRFVDADRSLPQQASLFDDINELLDDHTGSFAACDAGPVTTADARTHRQEFGIASFIHQDLRVLERATRFVHGSFTDHDIWPNNGRPRIAQATRLHHVPSGRDLTVVHLHGLRDPGGKADTPARDSQAHRLAEFIDHTQASGDITIVCGDLNLLPDSHTFAVLAELGLTDLVKTADTRTSQYTKPIRHANYMLVSHPGDVIAFSARPTPEVSDHRILQLDVMLRDRQGGS
jgi:endonuclease/exonuclease/phosphatase family metal-dependent hydrolase